MAGLVLVVLDWDFIIESSTFAAVPEEGVLTHVMRACCGWGSIFAEEAGVSILGLG